jgi:ABC-type transport system substrate-binding protein
MKRAIANVAFSNRRLMRRRALLAGGSITAGAGLLAVGCGGGSKDSGDSSGSALYKPQDTSSKAQRGGTWLAFEPGDPGGLDPRSNINVRTYSVAYHVYSRLFRNKLGVLSVPDGSTEPELVERYELSGDGTQLTLRLRKNVSWDERAPTNGRLLSSEDVRQTWVKFSAEHPSRADLSYSASKYSPIESLTTPDANTVVLKLAFPFGALITILASPSRFWILPKEAEGGFDPRGTARGTGPWRLTDWRPSASLTYEKNAKWHIEGRPFMDRLEYPILTDYSQQLAQFRAARIYSAVVRQEDILGTKADLPQLLLYQSDILRASTGLIAFGFADNERLFRDERVRQAASLAFDRETFLEVFSNSKPFENAGLPVEERYHSHLHAGEPLWLNPFGKDLGEGAKYFKHDVAEAKKLLAAAGYSAGLDTQGRYAAGTAYGAAYPTEVEATLPMLNEAGFRARPTPEDYNSIYLPQVLFSQGDHTGIGMTRTAPLPDAGEFFFSVYHPEGTRARVRKGMDTRLEQMIDSLRKEVDSAKRANLNKDIQRHLAVKMWAIPWPGGIARGFNLAWPWVGNIGVFTGNHPSEVLVNLWIDQSKLTRS